MALARHHCLDHPSIPAVSHCAKCHRPMCADCVAATDGNSAFCSENCLEDHRAFRRAYDAKRFRGPGRIAGLVRLAISIAVLVGLVYIGRWFGLGFCDSILKFVGL